MVSALYVRKDSVYKKLGVDCWDIDRNARLWPGGNPCICHPPCRAWGNFAWNANPRPGEKSLALWAITQVRLNGGVLEHPHTSKLWPNYLPIPGKIDKYGGWTLKIDQHWFGHLAKKTMYLYIVGLSPRNIPTYPLNFNCVTHLITGSTKTTVKKEVSRKQREETPLKLAKWLIELCTLITDYKPIIP